MLKSHPLIARFILFILIPLLVVTGYFYHYMNSSLPVITGKLMVSGLQSNSQITRDERGTVFIKSETDYDAFFSLGFIHAQDRMWQLEFQRRLAQGRLSEIIGEEALPYDIWMRTLGLYEVADSSWKVLSKEARMSLSAYTAGINAWLETKQQLPVEFDILDVTPEPWRELDSLAWSKVFALNISGNLDKEILNHVAAKYLSKDQLDSFFVDYPDDAPSTVSNLELSSIQALTQVYDLQKQFESELSLGGDFVGSNGWVVSGELMENGKSIMANDPHLGLQIPSLWYAAELQGDRIKVSGMTLVGLPLVIFGHNDSIAWGGTAMEADVQDLYVEQISAEEPNKYLHNGEWLSFNTRVETIEVRATFPSQLHEAINPVKILVRETLHGPIITDSYADLGNPISLRWTALDKNDSTYDALLKINYAKDWHSFNSALSDYKAPALNYLYSDNKNNIGFIAAGSVPVRTKGIGSVPVPGWTGEYQWQSYIPFKDWVRSYNPEKGYIVSANNKVVTDDYPYFISRDWAPPSRAKRIEDLLVKQIQQNKKLSVDFMAEMQMDTLDLGAVAFRNIIQGIKADTPKQKDALTLLSSWDGHMDTESSAASLFFVWMKFLKSQLFSDEFKGFWNKRADMQSLELTSVSASFEDIYRILSSNTYDWCDDVTTSNRESCNQAYLSALDLAIDELQGLAGSNPDSWGWGEIHFTVYRHTPLSNVKALKSVFGRKIANGGSPNTINVANAQFKESEGYEQTFGAGFRQIVQFNEQDPTHLFINSTGQSGNVSSPHYADMVEAFNQGRLYLFKPIESSSFDTLILSPSK